MQPGPLADVGTRHRRRHPDSDRVERGPCYWSTYGYENVTNTLIPEAVWKTNVDWVAATFRDFGYSMVCTDRWITTPSGSPRTAIS